MPEQIIPVTKNRKKTLDYIKERSSDALFAGNDLQDFVNDLKQKDPAKVIADYGLTGADLNKLGEFSTKTRESLPKLQGPLGRLFRTESEAKQAKSQAKAKTRQEFGKRQSGIETSQRDPYGSFVEGVGYGIAAPFAMLQRQRAGQPSAGMLQDPYTGNIAAEIGTNVGLALGGQAPVKGAGILGQSAAMRGVALPLAAAARFIPQTKAAQIAYGVGTGLATMGAGFLGGKYAGEAVQSRLPAAQLGQDSQAAINRRLATPEATLGGAALDLSFYRPYERAASGQMTTFGGTGLRGAFAELAKDPTSIAKGDVLEAFLDVTERGVSAAMDLSQARTANELAKKRYQERTGRIGTEADWIEEGYKTPSQLQTEMRLSAVAAGYGGPSRVLSGQSLFNMLANRPSRPAATSGAPIPAPVTVQPPIPPAASVTPTATVSPAATSALVPKNQPSVSTGSIPVTLPVVGGVKGEQQTVVVKHDPNWSDHGTVEPALTLTAGMTNNINNNIASKKLNKTDVPVEDGNARLTSITSNGEFAFTVSKPDGTSTMRVAPFSALPPGLKPFAQQAVTNVPGGESPDFDFIAGIKPVYNVGNDLGEIQRGTTFFQYTVDIDGNKVAAGIASANDIGKDFVTVTTPTSRIVVPKSSLQDRSGNTVTQPKVSSGSPTASIPSNISVKLPGMDMPFLVPTGTDTKNADSSFAWADPYVELRNANLSPDQLRAASIFPGARVDVQVGQTRRDAVIVGDAVDFTLEDGTQGSGIPVKLVDQLNVDPFIAPASLVRPLRKSTEGAGSTEPVLDFEGVSQSLSQSVQEAIDLLQSGGVPPEGSQELQTMLGSLDDITEGLANSDPAAINGAVALANALNEKVAALAGIEPPVGLTEDQFLVTEEADGGTGQPVDEQVDRVFGVGVSAIQQPDKATFPYGEQFKKLVPEQDLPVEMRGRGEKFRFYAQTKGEEVDRVAPAVRTQGLPADLLTKLQTIIGAVDIPKRAGTAQVEIKTVSNKDDFQQRLIDVWGQTPEQARALTAYVDRMATGWAMEQMRIAGINSKITLRAIRTEAELDLAPTSKSRASENAWRKRYKEQAIINPSEENLKLIKQLKGKFYTDRLGAIAGLTMDQAKAMKTPGATMAFKGDSNQVINVAFALKDPGAYVAQVHEVVHLMQRSMYAPTFHELAAAMMPAWQQKTRSVNAINQVITKDVEERMVTTLVNAIFTKKPGEPLLREGYREGGASHDAALNNMFNQIGQLMRDSIGAYPGISNAFPELNIGDYPGWQMPFDRMTKYRAGTSLLYKESLSAPYKEVVLKEGLDEKNIGTDGTKSVLVREFDKATNSYAEYRITDVESAVSGNRLLIGQMFASMDSADAAIMDGSRFNKGAIQIYSRLMGHWIEHTNNLLDRVSDEPVPEVRFEPVSVVDITRRSVGYKWFRDDDAYQRYVSQNFPELGARMTPGRIKGRIHKSYLGWLDAGGYETYMPADRIKELEYGKGEMVEFEPPQPPAGFERDIEEDEDESLLKLPPLRTDEEDEEPLFLSTLVAGEGSKGPTKFDIQMESLDRDFVALSRIPIGNDRSRVIDSIVSKISQPPFGKPTWMQNLIAHTYFQDFGFLAKVWQNSDRRFYGGRFEDEAQTYTVAVVNHVREMLERLTPDGQGNLQYWDWDDPNKVYVLKAVSPKHKQGSKDTLSALFKSAVYRGLAEAKKLNMAAEGMGKGAESIYRNPVYRLTTGIHLLNKSYASLQEQDFKTAVKRAVQHKRAYENWRRQSKNVPVTQSMVVLSQLSSTDLAKYGMSTAVRDKIIGTVSKAVDSGKSLDDVINRFALESKSALTIPVLHAYKVHQRLADYASKAAPIQIDDKGNVLIAPLTIASIAEQADGADTEINAFVNRPFKPDSIEDVFNTALGQEPAAPEVDLLGESGEKSVSQLMVENAISIASRQDFAERFDNVLQDEVWNRNDENKSAFATSLLNQLDEKFGDVLKTEKERLQILDFVFGLPVSRWERTLNVSNGKPQEGVVPAQSFALQFALDNLSQLVGTATSSVAKSKISGPSFVQALKNVVESEVDRLTEGNAFGRSVEDLYNQVYSAVEAMSMPDLVMNKSQSRIVLSIVKEYSRLGGSSESSDLLAAAAFLKTAMTQAAENMDAATRQDYLPKKMLTFRQDLTWDELKLLEDKRLARSIKPLLSGRELTLDARARLFGFGQTTLTGAAKSLKAKIDAKELKALQSAVSNKSLSVSQGLKVLHEGSEVEAIKSFLDSKYKEATIAERMYVVLEMIGRPREIAGIPKDKTPTELTTEQNVLLNAIEDVRKELSGSFGRRDETRGTFAQLADVENLRQEIDDIALIPPSGRFTPRDIVINRTRTTYSDTSQKDVKAIEKWANEKTVFRSEGRAVPVEGRFTNRNTMYDNLISEYQKSDPSKKLLTDAELASIAMINRGTGYDAVEVAAVLNDLMGQRDAAIRTPLKKWLSDKKGAESQVTLRAVNQYMDDNKFTDEQRLSAMAVLFRAMEVASSRDIMAFAIANKRLPEQADIAIMADRLDMKKPEGSKETLETITKSLNNQLAAIEHVQKMYGLDVLTQSVVGTRSEVEVVSGMTAPNNNSANSFFGFAFKTSENSFRNLDDRVVRSSIFDQFNETQKLFSKDDQADKRIIDAIANSRSVMEGVAPSEYVVSKQELERVKSALNADTIYEIAGSASAFWTKQLPVSPFAKKQASAISEFAPGFKKLTEKARTEAAKRLSPEARVAAQVSVKSAAAVKETLDLVSSIDLPIFKHISAEMLPSVFYKKIAIEGNDSEVAKIRTLLGNYAKAVTDDLIAARAGIIDAASNPAYDNFRYSYDNETGMVEVRDTSLQNNPVVFMIDYRNNRVYGVSTDGTQTMVTGATLEKMVRGVARQKSHHALIALLSYGLDKTRMADINSIVEAVDFGVQSIRVVPGVYWHGMNRLTPATEVSEIEPMYLSTLVDDSSRVYNNAGVTDQITREAYVHPVIAAWTRPDESGFQRVALATDGLPYYDGYGYSVFTKDRKRSHIYAQLVANGLSRDKALEVYALTEHPEFQGWKAGRLVESLKLTNPGSWLDQNRYDDPKQKQAIRRAIQAQDLVVAIDTYAKSPTTANLENFLFAFDEVHAIGTVYTDSELATFAKSITEIDSVEGKVEKVMSFRPIAEDMVMQSLGPYYNSSKAAVESYTGHVEGMESVQTGRPFTTLAFENTSDSYMAYKADGVKSFDLGSGLYKNKARRNSPTWIRFKNPLVYDAKNNNVLLEDMKSLMEQAFAEKRDGLVIQNLKDEWKEATRKNVAITLDDTNVLPAYRMTDPVPEGSKARLQQDVEPMYLSTLVAPVTARTIPTGPVIPTAPSKRTGKDIATDIGLMALDTAQDAARASLSMDFAFSFIQSGRAFAGALSPIGYLTTGTMRAKDTLWAFKALGISMAGLAPNLAITLPGPKGKKINVGFDKLGRRAYMNIYSLMAADPFFQALRESDASLHMIAMERNIEQERMRQFTRAGGSVPYASIQLNLMDFDEGGNMTDFFGNKSLISKLPLRGMAERQMSLQHDILLFNMLKAQAYGNPAFNAIPVDQLGKNPLWQSFVRAMALTMGDLQYSSNEVTDMRIGMALKVALLAPRWGIANVLSLGFVNKLVSAAYEKSPQLKQIMGSDPRAFYLRGKISDEYKKNPKLQGYLTSHIYGTFLWWSVGLPMLIRLASVWFQNSQFGIGQKAISSFRIGDYLFRESTGSTDALDVANRTLSAMSQVGYTEKGRYGKTAAESAGETVADLLNKSFLYKAGPLVTRPISYLYGKNVIGEPVFRRNDAARRFYDQQLPKAISSLMKDATGYEMPTSEAMWDFMPSYIQDWAETFYTAERAGKSKEEARIEANKMSALSFLGIRVRYDPYQTEREKKSQRFGEKMETQLEKNAPSAASAIRQGGLKTILYGL